MMNGYGVITHVGHIAHKSFSQFQTPSEEARAEKHDDAVLISFQQSTSNVFGKNRT